MRAVVQRVTSGKVTVEEETIGSIGTGVVVFLGVGQGDTKTDVLYLAEKIAMLRIFADEQGKMNRSLLDINGQALVVSQFTLYGDVRNGRRPYFGEAASGEMANELYEEFVVAMKDLGLEVATGQFQASMVVSLDNEGPVTILLDSKKNF